MDQVRWTRFLVANVLLVGVGFAVGAVLLPPDPLSQLPVTIEVVILSIPVSYWLVYKGGLVRLRGRVEN